MKLFMKNFDKVTTRAYSGPQSNSSEIIDLESSENPQAIKKSSISYSELQTAAIKKSSIPVKNSELIISTTLPSNPSRSSKLEIQERPNKFLKVEKNDKSSRVKKPEETRLSSLVKMREKFNHNKSSSGQFQPSNSLIPDLEQVRSYSIGLVDALKSSFLTSSPPSEPLYQFSEELQKLTGVKSGRSLSDLEIAFRFYLRTNSKALVNCYDFSENELICSILNRKQLNYLDISSFIELNSSLIN